MSRGSFFAGLLMSGNKLEQYKEGGNSMSPIIKSNQPVDVEPVNEETLLTEGSIVFCKVRGSYYTHLILKIKGDGDKQRFQIGNNKGGINGWIPRKQIYGIVTKIYK